MEFRLPFLICAACVFVHVLNCFCRTQNRVVTIIFNLIRQILLLSSDSGYYLQLIHTLVVGVTVLVNLLDKNVNSLESEWKQLEDNESK